MKYLLILFIVAMFFINLSAQTPIPPSAGNGSENYPYQIANLNNLYWISASNTRWGFHYIQTSDIDASETVNWFGGSGWNRIGTATDYFTRSEEHTSELQSRPHLVCRLLLEKKKNIKQ